MKKPSKGPPVGKRKDLRIYVSQEVNDRLTGYAKRIGGSVTSIVLQWIMDKLPESERNLFPSTGLGTPPGAPTESKKKNA